MKKITKLAYLQKLITKHSAEYRKIILQIDDNEYNYLMGINTTTNSNSYSYGYAYNAYAYGYTYQNNYSYNNNYSYSYTDNSYIGLIPVS